MVFPLKADFCKQTNFDFSGQAEVSLTPGSVKWWEPLGSEHLLWSLWIWCVTGRNAVHPGFPCALWLFLGTVPVQSRNVWCLWALSLCQARWGGSAGAVSPEVAQTALG